MMYSYDKHRASYLPVLMSMIAALALASGRGKYNSLSNLPGLLRAGSIASGLLVAPITTTYHNDANKKSKKITHE